jgi:hypothetical protein
MKTLLAILLSFIVTEAPVLAIHGGYTLGGAAGVIGDYAGVLVPLSDTILTTGSSSADFGQNALGLFTLSIPSDGIGSGAIFLFSSGQQLTGPIQALPDPNNIGGIVGIIQATGNVNVASFNSNGSSNNSSVIVIGFNETETQVTGQASGGFTAVTENSTVTNSPTGINLSGTSNITVTTASTGTDGATIFTPTDSIVFAVNGFQQSATPSSTATITQ